MVLNGKHKILLHYQHHFIVALGTPKFAFSLSVYVSFNIVVGVDDLTMHFFKNPSWKNKLNILSYVCKYTSTNTHAHTDKQHLSMLSSHTFGE